MESDQKIKIFKNEEGRKLFRVGMIVMSDTDVTDLEADKATTSVTVKQLTEEYVSTRVGTKGLLSVLSGAIIMLIKASRGKEEESEGELMQFVMDKMNDEFASTRSFEDSSMQILKKDKNED